MRKYALTIGLGLTLLGGSALARGLQGPPPGPDIGGRIERLADQLDVTAEQRDALRQIVDDRRARHRSLHDRMRANAEAVHALDPAADDYQARVSVLAAEHGDIAAQMLQLRAETRAAIHGVLSEDQRARLASLPGPRRHRPDGRRLGPGR